MPDWYAAFGTGVMAEVFTISGANFGQPTPDQYAALEQQNAQVIQRQVARSKISPAVLLQNALKALGVSRGDPALSKLKIDGVIGPNTVKAANLAFAKYIGTLPAPLGIDTVRRQADQLAQQITAYVEAHGGMVPQPPPPARRAKNPAMILPPSSIPSMPAQAIGTTNNKWIWYVVGGVGVLLSLAIVAKIIRGSRRAPDPAKA